VDDHLHVIEHDPLARRKPIDGNGADALIVSQSFFNLAGDRL
jgi:hypothetical protein